jgi:hypothetical protein
MLSAELLAGFRGSFALRALSRGGLALNPRLVDRGLDMTTGADRQ